MRGLTCRFSLEPAALSLGPVPYTQSTEVQFALVNHGGVPFDYMAALHPSEGTEVLAPCGACALAPEKGHVAAFGREIFRLQVSFKHAFAQPVLQQQSRVCSLHASHAISMVAYAGLSACLHKTSDLLLPCINSYWAFADYAWHPRYLSPCRLGDSGAPGAGAAGGHRERVAAERCAVTAP